MTTSGIPPIVLLVDSDREMLDQYSRRLEADGLWVAATTSYDELVSSAEELHPDVIIADTDSGGADTDGVRTVEVLKQHRELAATPVVVLVSPAAAGTPNADVTLRKPVPPDLLLRRTREVLAYARELRGRSNAIVQKSHTLLERSDRLMERAAAIANDREAGSRACPTCSTSLDWVERGTIGGVTYDYFRWCSRGCGLFCYNRDSSQWIKLA